jgi:hypothetical protein
MINPFPSHMTLNLLTSPASPRSSKPPSMNVFKRATRAKAAYTLSNIPNHLPTTKFIKIHQCTPRDRPRHNLAMANPPTPLHRFKEAMQSVYGPFETLSPPDVAKWTPPPKSGGHRGRYLWTDAFGVLNFLTLYHTTSSPLYLSFAKSLAHSVHSILGSTRDGKSRLPGATDAEPLKGGLRIGKIDEEGSDGDGMYHHYLTLWMFALNRLSIASEEKEWNELAVQLAKAVHGRFVIKGTGGRKRMVWKISTDMKRVLVPSEGHLDAATGYVVFRLLQDIAGEKVLEGEIGEYKELMEGKLTASSDCLDLGMALWMCHFFKEDEEWAKTLGEKCLINASKWILVLS